MPNTRSRSRYDRERNHRTSPAPDHPIDMRTYYLTSEDRGIAGDTAYTLVFTDRGEMLVQVTRRHEQKYRAPEVSEIPARDVATTTVNGVPLLRIVVQKLDEI